MPTTRTETAIASLLAATPVPTIIQKSLIATETIAHETRIDCEMMAMLQRETDIMNEIVGTTIAETAIERSIQEAVVIVSPTPSCPLRQPLLSAVLVLWRLLLTVQTLPPKDVIVSTKIEIEIEIEKEKETGSENENAISATVNMSTIESSASVSENSETGSVTSVNTKENVIETWRETARKNATERTIVRLVLVKDPERGSETGPGILRHLIAAKTSIEVRDDTAPSELTIHLNKAKIIYLPLTSDNVRLSLRIFTHLTSGSVFPNASVLALPNLQRLTPMKIIAAGWNRHKEICRAHTITQTRIETNAQTEPSPVQAGPPLLLSRPPRTTPKTRTERIEFASLSPRLTEKIPNRSRVS